MRVEIKDDLKTYILHDVVNIVFFNRTNTQCEELQNACLIIHKQNHCEKYRLYKNYEIISIGENNERK